MPLSAKIWNCTSPNKIHCSSMGTVRSRDAQHMVSQLQIPKVFNEDDKPQLSLILKNLVAF